MSKEMHISENGINLIREFEGLRLKAYKAIPSEKYYTIGYGHYGCDVTADMTITIQQAVSLLKKDLAKFEMNVNKYHIHYCWSQNEFDALVSFAFNIGSIDQLTNKGSRVKSVIAEKIPLYCKAGGKVLPGLVRRRAAEKELFMRS